MKGLGPVILFVLTSIVSVSSIAEDVPAVCKLKPQNHEQVIPSDDVSGSYWTNMMGDDTVLFTADGGNAGKYQGFDLKNKRPFYLTNDIDPFPVPDGRRVYVHPNPLEFFDMDDVLKVTEKKQKSVNSGEVPKIEIKNDPKLFGFYESVGTLESVKKSEENSVKNSETSGSDYSIYRVLTGQGQGTVMDYKVDYSSKPYKAVALGDKKPLVLCPNLRKGGGGGILFDTPIISPKGDEFAVIDRATNSTVVMKFDPETGNCKKVFDFGFATGKVHFSPDGSKIAFHTTSLKVPKSEKYTQNQPFVFDRKTNKLTSLSVGDVSDGENGLVSSGSYPVFRSDGTMLYQRVTYNKTTGKQHRAWVIVDPSKFNSITLKPLMPDAEACSDKNEFTSQVLLSELWQKVCTKHTLGYTTMIANLFMDPELCAQMVNEYWKNDKKDIIKKYQSKNKKQSKNKVKAIYENLKLSKTFDSEMLKAACPKVETTDDASDSEIQGDGVKLSMPLVVQSRCVQCHMPGSPVGHIPFDNPEKMRSMPAIGSSSEPGKPFYGKTFVEQLEIILKENTEKEPTTPGIPSVPAEGPRLHADEVKEIIDWVKTGKAGSYNPPLQQNNTSVGAQ